MNHTAYYESPLGILEIQSDDYAVTMLKLTAEFRNDHHPTPLSDLAAAQINEYLRGTRSKFSFPLNPVGTAFQKAVWNILSDIPYGETRTYGQIAAQIGKPGAARAVGMACNRNPIWIVIPCHRVISASNGLSGYAGGLTVKQALLNLERKIT